MWCVYKQKMDMVLSASSCGRIKELYICMDQMKGFFKNKHQSKSGSQKESKEGWTKIQRSPAVRTLDLNNGSVKVEILLPRLEPGKDKFTHKLGTVCFDFLNNNYGFDMTAVFDDMSTKTETTWKFQVLKLPTKIDKENSKWHLEKGKIVVIMEKDRDYKDVSWQDMVDERGLDQQSSSSSSSDDDVT